MKSIGIQMSGTVFELGPENYLKDTNDGCEIQFAANTMTGKHAEVYLIGDTFLKHFYAYFDMDKEEIGLGVNIHSKE